MQKVFSLVVAVILVSVCLPLDAGAQEAPNFEPYTADQLDNLLAPIALYPDPLLAQVLVAATFSDQIDQAARWVRAYGQNGIDDQPWDVSVRAVAHYPMVLDMMDDNLDWTTAVGEAYVYQSTDVMLSVQRLREMARAQGNLVTTPQQEVVVENGYISIWPAGPEYIYVPSYDPSILFFHPAYAGGIFTAFSFGPRLRIGVWLNLDCDWHQHRVYYTGWQGRGWIARARPHIGMSPVYVNARLSTVAVNRRAAQRPLNFADLGRYHSVHGNNNFANRARGPLPAHPQEIRPSNKIIDRNIIPNQNLDRFRGHVRPAPAPPPGRAREPARAPAARPPSAPPPRTPTTRRPAAQTPAAPRAQPPSTPRPSAFGRGNGPFESRAASQRGRESRQEMNRKPPAARRPAPQHQRKPEGR